MSKVEKKQLFDDSGTDEEDESKIKINKSYAQRYDEWREAEIKRKLEDRYGNLDEQLSSSSSDDDDDDPQELEKVLSKDFFEVISQLRKKDPKIYNPDVRFFKAEEQPSTSQEKQKKEKPIYLRDYERKLIVERGGVLSDDESDNERPQRPASPSLAEKERSLKESLQKIVHSDSEDDDEGGLLTKKVKSEEQKKKEEDDYIEWLRGRKDELKDKNLEESLSYLKSEWNNPNLDEGEKFLRDYVLNKRYMDGGDEEADTGNLTDEDFQDKYMDDFERKFNFRFEEPDSEFLKRFPRTIESSVRKKDDRRKRHRDEVKKRKEEEKLRQREELKVLKSLKRKEILKKIEKLKEITGNAELGISDKDLEGDYDPEEHDRRMNELFNDDYYQDGDEELNLEDLPLPPLEEDLADDYENWDEYEGEKEDQVDEELHCEDPNFIMDCDFDPEAAALAKEAQPKSSRERRKLKRQSRFGTLVRKKKPQFDPNEKSFQDYVDEYYGIDYEDIVGGQPCRFKYRKVLPNSFGLTIEEILAADDKELNAWVSIKKATALRPDHVEMNEKRIYELKAQNEALKRKILPSLYKNETEGNTDDVENKPRSKKNKKSFSGEDTSTYYDDTDVNSTSVGKKKERKNSFGVEDNEVEMDVKTTPQKKKKSKKIKSFSEEDTSTFNEDEEDVKTTPEKKKKIKSFSEEDTSTFNEDEEDVKATSRTQKKSFGGEDKSTCNEGEMDNMAIPEKKKKKKVAEEGDCEESGDVRAKKKSKHRVNESVTTEEVEEENDEENAREEVQTHKLSKKERKRLERQLKESKSSIDTVETMPDSSVLSKKKGMKRSAEAMDESIDDVSGDPKLKKKRKKSGQFSQESKKIEVNNGAVEKLPGKKFSQGGSQAKSSNPNKNRGQIDLKNKDNKNKVKPISKERLKRQRRGKDRKKLLAFKKDAGKAQRDVNAVNKERAIRRQNYKAAPVVGEISDSRLKAYGINPKKFKNKLVYG